MVVSIKEVVNFLPEETRGGWVLVVEDEPLTRTKIARSLERADFQIMEAATGEQALERCAEHPFDLVILDILLPGISGFDVCQRLHRSHPRTAIIMLTNLFKVSDRTRGLSLGADDYMIKPFHPQELVARAKAVLRRSREAAVQENVLTVGNLRIELNTQRCFKNGHPLDLTHKEFQLLTKLCTSQGEAVSRADLVDSLWGEHHFGSEKGLDVYVGRLRQKVEDDPETPRLIQTVRGIGYRCG